MKKITMLLGLILAAATTVFAEPHAFPVPCVVNRDGPVIHFTDLPNEGTVKIFTITGDEVRSLNIPTGLATVDWDLLTSEGKKAATGVYIYLVEGGGSKTDGKIIVIR